MTNNLEDPSESAVGNPVNLVPSRELIHITLTCKLFETYVIYNNHTDISREMVLATIMHSMMAGIPPKIKGIDIENLELVYNGVEEELKKRTEGKFDHPCRPLITEHAKVDLKGKNPTKAKK